MCNGELGFERFSLAVRILGDTLPQSADAIYLVGQTRDNQASVLVKGADLYHRRYPRKPVAILGSQPASGYPGALIWRQELLWLKVEDEYIYESSFAGSTVNTLDEARAFAQMVKTFGWRKIVLVAPHFHLPRAFMTFASVILWEHLDVQLYACPGQPLPWDEEASHSQGTTHGTRFDLLEGEAERIEKYVAKGDMVQLSEIRNYLLTRDKKAVI